MPSADRRDRFLRSMTATERAIFDQATVNYMGKAADNGIALTADQCQLCAAAKIMYWRDHGIRAAQKFKVGKVPTDWPDVEAPKERAKRVQRTPKEETEKYIQGQIVRFMLQRGWLVIRFNSGVKAGDSYFKAYTIENSGANAGVSDLICFKAGKHLFLEVKSATGSLRPTQKAFMDLASQCGEAVFVVRSVEEVSGVVRRAG
jgi:hypothetical protein